MLEEHFYCASMNVSGTEFIQRMNCSFYLTNQLLMDSDCLCPLSCKEILYRYTMAQSPWPHLSYHLPLYTKVIRNMSFVDHFSEYYEPLADLEYTDDEFLIYPELRKTDLISRNFIQVHVKMEANLLVKYVEKEALSLESFIGGIGGLLNLWTGISFFVILEIFELVYKLVWPPGKVGENAGVGKHGTKRHEDLPEVS